MPAEFNEYAAAYDEALQQGLRLSGEGKEYFAAKRIEWLAQRLRQKGIANPAAILDYGCGIGGSIPYLTHQFHPRNIVGVDVSEESLAIAQSAFPEARFGTLEQYSPQGEIDLTFCNGVFHHIPPGEREACARYIYEALKPGGVFAFWENNPWNPGTRLVMKRVPFDRNAIMLSAPESKRLLQSVGFRVEAVDFLFIFPRMLAALRWLEPPLASLPLGGQYLVFARKP